MEGEVINDSFVLGYERFFYYVKKFGLCFLENGGYLLEGLVLYCDRILFVFYKNYFGVGYRVFWREVFSGKVC